MEKKLSSQTENIDLQQALEELAQQQQNLLESYLLELRKVKELIAVLPTARDSLIIQENQIVSKALFLLTQWQNLGGSISLNPPLPSSTSVFAQRPVAPVQAPPPVTQAPAPVAQTLVTQTPVTQPVQAPVTQAPIQNSDPISPIAQAPVQTPQAREIELPRPIIHKQELNEPFDWISDVISLQDEIRISENTQEEMQIIHQAANASFSRWANYPRAVQRSLVGNLACRLRHLQDHLHVTDAHLDAAFRSLTRFSKSFQPGWVNGLTRGRGPVADSWIEEAQCWWNQLNPADGDPNPPKELKQLHLSELERWLNEWREAPEVAKAMCLEKSMATISKTVASGIPANDPDLCRLAGEIYDLLDIRAFRKVRQAIRDLEIIENEDTDEKTQETIPSGWPWWSHTVGRRAVFLGGAPSTDFSKQVEQNFGFATLYWLKESPEELGQVEDLIKSNEVDLLIMFGDNEESQLQIVKPAQEASLPWVKVKEGQSITRIKMAVERYLQPDNTTT